MYENRSIPLIIDVSGGIDFMSRPDTLARWQKIVDGYDRNKETLKAYCQRLGISPRLYHTYRTELYGRSDRSRFKSDKLLPVVIDNSAETELTVNNIRLAYKSGSVSDTELRRILKLCRDL